MLPNVKAPPATSPCILSSKTTLSDIQGPTVDYFNTHDSLLVVFGTGVGKTLTAITAGECFLKANPMSEVVVLTTTTLKKNFENQFASYGKVNQNRYKVFSYSGYMTDYKKGVHHSCANSLLIIDEVHLLRNYTGKQFEAVMDCAQFAKKVLLLTATPFVNGICDFISIINLLHQKYIIRPKNVPASLENIPLFQSKVTKYFVSNCDSPMDHLTEKMTMFGKLLQGRVAFTEKRSGVYPTSEIITQIIPMSKEYEDAFLRSISTKDIFEKPAAFASGYRRAVNAIGDEGYINGKMVKALEIIKSDTSAYARNVIFTNWVDFGIEKLKPIFLRENISFRIISGETNVKDRNIIVQDFNNGKFNTLIITKAGTEGIDLKGVQKIIVLDPVWNNATLDQIKGRGVRNNSHIFLPEAFRKVKIYLLVYVEKSFFEGKTARSYSGDHILYKFIEQKSDIESHIKTMLNSISIL